ncbi:MAG: ATP-binding protein [Actinomycetota bacterium]
MSDSAAETADREGGTPPPEVRHLSGPAKIAILTASLATVAAALFTFGVLNIPGPSGHLRTPLWALAAMFALAEILVVHVEFRGNAYSFSLSELPFVIGLFTAAPVDLVAAHLLGSAIALIVHRRQSALKLAFNLSHFALESCLALLVFNAFGTRVPLEPAAWVATLLATLTSAFVADLAVETAVSLAEGRLERRGMLQRMSFGKVLSATNASIGLIGALILWVEPSAAWVLAVPTAILFFSYRVYTSQREQHARMEFLYESTHLLNRSLKMEASLPALLSQAQTMFRAETAEILLFAPEGEPMLRTLVGPDDHEEVLIPVKLDPTEGLWARVAAEGQALLFTRPIEPQRLRLHFAEQGIRDAMIAPLRGTDGIVGTIMVGNRLGDVSTFDANDLQMFEALANHASVSIENARLVQRLEESLIHMTEMNRMKDDFVATVSHELRTPLTSIQGSVKTLLQPDLEFNAEDRQTLLEVVDRQGERLRQLIEDLLVAARIEAQPIRAVISPVSLSTVAKQVIEGLGSRAASHRVVFDVAGDPGKIETDERRVYQILSNLVDNALKYAPTDTTLTLRVSGVPGGVQVLVEDQGPGIPDELQERIFDRFYQVDQTSTRAVGGTGLGLYICRRLTEVIGAKIALERSDEHGSVFSLIIPLKPPADAIRAEDIPIDETLDLIAAQRR